MFSRIIKKGEFVFGPGIKSSYNYDYSSLSDAMNHAYCELLNQKLARWQDDHGKFDVVVGIETEGVRIGYQLSLVMGLPFHIIPHRQVAMDQLEIPKYSANTHWLIVDDIVTTGSSFIRAVDFLDIQEKPESVTFACMIQRNPKNLDYSAVHGDRAKEQFQVRDERFDFIDKRLVTLFSEAE